MAGTIWTPPAISGDVGVYSTPSTASSLIRQGLSADATIDGISGGAFRGSLTIANISDTYTLTFKNRNTSVPGAMLILPDDTDLPCPPDSLVSFWFDSINNGWRVQSITSGGTSTEFTATEPGIVPASGGGTTNYLRADGTWDDPPGSGGVPPSRNINTTAPLTGGGNLSADLTLAVSQFTSTTAGTVSSSGGGSTNYLRADNTWDAPPGTGVPTSTQVIAGTGLSGGGALTGNVTLNIANTAVTAGSYTFADITVNAEGQLTAASSGSAVPTSTQVIAGTGLSGGGALTGNVTLNIANTAVTAGSYTNTNLTVNAQGQITAASNGSGSGGSGAITATFNACPTSSVNFTTQGVYDWLITDGLATNPIQTSTSAHYKALGGYVFRTLAWRTDGTSGISAQNFTSTGFSMATTAPDDIQNNTSLSGIISSVIVFTSSSTVINWGYRFSVPADTQTRYLRIYGEQFSCDLQGYFRLTDGSHADVTVTKTGTAGAGTQHMLECVYNGVVGGWLDVIISATVNHGSSPNVKLAGITLSNS
jgi:hypothetical protein